MTEEQAAFVKAYADCVGSAPEEYVKAFVQCHEGKDMEDSIHYTSVMDALCLWGRAKTYFKGGHEMKQKITPYNTGKVLIGKDYVPTTRHVVSQDMFRLQANLLGRPEPTTPETWMLRFVAAFAVVIIVLDLFVWRP